MNDLVSMRRSSVFNFQQIPHFALASLLLTLNNITYCTYCKLWTKCKHCSSVFIVNLEQTSDIVLVFFLFTLNNFRTKF